MVSWLCSAMVALPLQLNGDAAAIRPQLAVPDDPSFSHVLMEPCTAVHFGAMHHICNVALCPLSNTSSPFACLRGLGTAQLISAWRV